jgi:antitoxin HicB
MTRELQKYPFAVRPLSKEEGGGFLCEFPDIPGVIGDGTTVEAAIKDGRKALKTALAALKQLRRGLPHPPVPSGQWRMRAPRSLHRRLAERARAEGVSLNTLVISLIAEGLGRRDKNAA